MDIPTPENPRNHPSSSNCPYAVALHHDETDEQSQDSAELTEAALRHCPAFQKGSCPFKDAKSSEQVRQTLLEVPPSHFEQSGQFYKVIQELHHLNPSIPETPTKQAFHLPGGCPVQPLLKKTTEQQVSFTEALEGMSLSAIMARMASEMMEEDSSESTNDDGESHAVKTQAVTDSMDGFAKTVAAHEDTQFKNKAEDQTVSLSESLKTGTAVSHQAAEDVHFVKNFVKGKIDRKLYGDLVTMLYHVYAVLEDCLNQHAPRVFPTCHFPEKLSRTEALLEDMDFWHGRLIETMTPATRDYVDRLQYVARTDPLLLLAHAYTRYLGDLSGGRILARVARKAMMLGQDGLAFYQFGKIDSPKKFKDAYRHSLDALPLTAPQITKLVAEANVAFCLNMRLFEELDVKANVPGASVRPLADALAFANVDPHASSTLAQDKEQCPFATVNTKGGHVDMEQAAAVKHGKRCPWPFVFAHDPWQGMKDWQTWVVLGLILCFGWSMVQKTLFHAQEAR